VDEGRAVLGLRDFSARRHVKGLAPLQAARAGDHGAPGGHLPKHGQHIQRMFYCEPAAQLVRAATPNHCVSSELALGFAMKKSLATK